MNIPWEVLAILSGNVVPIEFCDNVWTRRDLGPLQVGIPGEWTKEIPVVLLGQATQDGG